MSEQKTRFPILPERWWWELRKHFKQKIPTEVNARYLSTVLDIATDTAAKIALPALKKVGLIDQTGKPGEIAVRWRDDEQYENVCQEMLQQLYPSELLEAVPKPIEDRHAVARWFANYTAAGESAVRKMTAFYQLLHSGYEPLDSQPRGDKEAQRSPAPRKRMLKPKVVTAKSEPSATLHPSPLQPTQVLSSSMHPSLELLIRSLPPEGSVFSETRRRQWLRMAQEVLTFLYPEEEEIENLE